jgi:hypothetical protein
VSLSFLPPAATIGFPNIGLQGFSPKVTRGNHRAALGESAGDLVVLEASAAAAPATPGARAGRRHPRGHRGYPFFSLGETIKVNNCAVLQGVAELAGGAGAAIQLACFGAYAPRDGGLQHCRMLFEHAALADSAPDRTSARRRRP